MGKNSRKDDYIKIFEGVDASERVLVDRLIDEVVYLEERMEQLRAMPFIQIHPDNPALQRTTAAAKQYKECSQSYMNAIRILLNVLRKVDADAENELLKKLEEFS